MRPTGRCAPTDADGEVEAEAVADGDELAADATVDDDGDPGVGAAGLHAIPSTPTTSTRASPITVRRVTCPLCDRTMRIRCKRHERLKAAAVSLFSGTPFHPVPRWRRR